GKGHGAGSQAAGFASAVRRLRGVAARLVARGDVGGATGVLEESFGRSGHVGVAGRSSAAGYAGPSRRKRRDQNIAGDDPAIAGTQPEGRCNSVHDVAGWFPDIAVEVYGAAERCGRNADRRAAVEGDRTVDRILRQYAGVADGDGEPVECARSLATHA